jgi:DHA1 family bicyclomycin/chloramphenicol resistance-like MFS transporter
MKLPATRILLLGLLSAVGPVSTDIYLPAFARIDHDFGQVGAAQITLAAWFVGLTIGQMVQGPLSDRLGRRMPLLWGTLAYAAASVGCALAPGLVSFSLCRVAAAAFGSASMVGPRAVVRDVAEGYEAARLLSRLTLVLGVVPILAPALGGVLLTFMSWRDLFWAAAAYGLVCSLLVWLFLPETLPSGRRLRHGLTETLARYRTIAREPVFVTNVLMGGFAFAGLFAYIGGSASVYTLYFGLTPAQYGVVFGLNAVGSIGCSQLSASAAARFGVDRVLNWTSLLMFLGYAVAAMDALARFGGLAGLAVPIFISQSVWGLMVPLTTVNALSRHQAHAGSASALLGTWQFGLGALSGVAVGLAADGTPVPMTLLMAGFVGLAVMADRLRPRSVMTMEKKTA